MIGRSTSQEDQILRVFCILELGLTLTLDPVCLRVGAEVHKSTK